MDEQIHQIIIEEEIVKALSMLYIPPNIAGYSFIKTAVLCGVIDPNSLTNLRKGVYEVIKRRYSTVDAHIERNIRHAIKVISINGGLFALNEMTDEVIYSGVEKIKAAALINYITNYVSNQVNRRLVGFTKFDEDKYLKDLRNKTLKGEMGDIQVKKIKNIDNLFLDCEKTAKK